MDGGIGRRKRDIFRSFSRFARRGRGEKKEEKKNIGKRRVSVERIRARFEALIFRNERVSENEIRNMTDNRDFSDREIHSNFSPPHGSPVFRLEVNPRSLISLLAVSR